MMFNRMLLAGAALGAMTAASHAQVPMPGFFGAVSGSYIVDAPPKDFAEFAGDQKGKPGDGFGGAARLGYRFDMPWDVSVGFGGGWMSRGKAVGAYHNRTKADYFAVDGTVGYTFADGPTAIRPYVGIVYVDYTHKFADQVAPIWSGKIDYWGVGPRFGVDASAWLDDTSFFVTGGVGGAVTFGKIRQTGTFASSATSRTAYNASGNIGLGYQFDGGVNVVVGYQADGWFGVNYRIEEDSKGRGDRVAHGPFIRVAYNFGPPVRAVTPPVASPTPTESFMVFFDFDKSNLTAQATNTIKQAADAYKAKGYARLTSTGHADRSGNDAYNMALSLRRANTVKDELVRNGIPAASIVVVGRGESMPLVQTADGVREPQNRRVEIVLGR